MRQNVLGNPGPLSVDRERDVVPGSERRRNSFLGSDHGLLSGGQRDHASLAQRVAGVEGEIDDHALELRGIRDDRRDTVGKLDLDRDVGGQHALQELLNVRDDFVDTEQARIEHLAAAEREQLARQLGRPVGGLRDLVDVGDVLRVRQ